MALVHGYRGGLCDAIGVPGLVRLEEGEPEREELEKEELEREELENEELGNEELEKEELEKEELENEELENEELDKTVVVDSVVLVGVLDNSNILNVVAGKLVVPDVLMVVAGDVVVPDSGNLSVAANGYGSSEVVTEQQLGPPSCPATPAQYQSLPLGSQRLTSV